MRIRRKAQSPGEWERGLDWRRVGRGKRKTISISKIKKTTAKRKKRREKGSRAEFFGSNPHS